MATGDQYVENGKINGSRDSKIPGTSKQELTGRPLLK